MMFGGDRDRHEDRGFFDRLGDRARASFGDDDRDHRHWSRDTGHGQSDRGRGAWDQDRYWSNSKAREQFRGSDWDQSQRSSSHPDDHYRSWREKQMQSLDRDYQEYCREREQQFHQDFDSWRQQRYGGNPGPLRTGSRRSILRLIPLCRLSRPAFVLEAEALAGDLHDVRVVQQAVEHRRCQRLVVSKGGGPLREWQVAGQHH